MSPRKAAAVADEAPETHDGSAEFEVEPHGAQSEHAEEPAAAPETPEDAANTVATLMGWTPEEATQLICAIWNFGIILYGPEWAADPRETLGWNFHAAQLLDHVLPKGTGGYVELGAGLIMVGNGLAMMGLRRRDIIAAGPKPIWVKPKATQEPGAPPPGPAPAPSPSVGSNGKAGYKIPKDLTPVDDDPLRGMQL